MKVYWEAQLEELSAASASQLQCSGFYGRIKALPLANHNKKS